MAGLTDSVRLLAVAVAAELIVMVVALAIVAIVAPKGIPGPEIGMPTTSPAVLGTVTVVVELVDAFTRLTEGRSALKTRFELSVPVPFKRIAPMSLVFALRTRRVPPEIFAVVRNPKTLAVPVIVVGALTSIMLAGVAPTNVLVAAVAGAAEVKPTTGS